ncbi:carbohydrate sulfotransferase 13-like isoform X3 [Pollicipes pollicipes]|uniref:carbohydrate sulfotransferase 13-like isoform X3 n=1 Tax=Pollicipes pollicipes TaxID=41117 RepID=UPI001884C65E|nr:carbohydrate sulfotransferase 13-like isoform X3 [Pollicipes pollicipes]
MQLLRSSWVMVPFRTKASSRTLLYSAAAISLVGGLLFIYGKGIDSPMMPIAAGDSDVVQVVSNQEERHMTMKLACDATKSLRPDEELEYLIQHSKFLDHIIVNEDHKLLYCYIPKVSSTQWKKVMGVLSGTLPDRPLNEILGRAPHERGVHRFLSDFPLAEVRNRLATYTSFLFVRHPLERLVSGYVNKFAKAGPDGYFNRLFSAEIKRQFGDGQPASNTSTVTFDSFARWVSNPHPKNVLGARNEHWKPMVDLCHPCAVNYTIIGKMETLAEDARLVLRSARVTSVAFPAGFRSRTHDTAADLFSSLEPDVQRHVLRLYFEDLLVFGYRPSDLYVANTTAHMNSRIMFESLLV